MWKQSFWFAVAGSVTAVLASSAGDLAFTAQSIDIFDGGSRFVTRYRGPQWGQIGAIAATGAVVGALIGLTAYLAGARVVTAPQSRVGRVVAAGLVGVALGLSPALLLVAGALRGLEVGTSVAVEPASLLTLYGVSAVLAYGAALLAVRSVLRIAGDDLTRLTTRCTAMLLPVGAIASTAAGVGTAWLFDFSTTPYTVVASSLVVVLILSATFAVSRSWALRRQLGAE